MTDSGIDGALRTISQPPSQADWDQFLKGHGLPPRQPPAKPKRERTGHAWGWAMIAALLIYGAAIGFALAVWL
jgi:hypothetical protein